MNLTSEKYKYPYSRDQMETIGGGYENLFIQILA